MGGNGKGKASGKAKATPSIHDLVLALQRHLAAGSDSGSGKGPGAGAKGAAPDGQRSSGQKGGSKGGGAKSSEIRTWTCRGCKFAGNWWKFADCKVCGQDWKFRPPGKDPGASTEKGSGSTQVRGVSGPRGKLTSAPAMVQGTPAAVAGQGAPKKSTAKEGSDQGGKPILDGWIDVLRRHGKVQGRQNDKGENGPKEGEGPHSTKTTGHGPEGRSSGGGGEDVAMGGEDAVELAQPGGRDRKSVV